MVDDKDVEVVLVHHDVGEFAGLASAEEGGVGFEVVAVDLPDETGLGGIAHPCENAGAGLEEFCDAGFVHGAEIFVIGELGFADEVGEIGDGAIAAGR